MPPRDLAQTFRRAAIDLLGGNVEQVDELITRYLPRFTDQGGSEAAMQERNEKQAQYCRHVGQALGPEYGLD